MGRDAEAFMEQIIYYWTNMAKMKDKIKFINKMVDTWKKLDKKLELKIKKKV
jgi:hypothetical protein